MGMFDDVLENVGEPFGGGGKGFEYGTHEVIIGEINPTQKKTKANDKAEVIEVTVFDEKEQDRTATCTLYFHTEGGAKMSVAKVLGLMVHKVPEDKKDAVRELGKKLFGSIDDPTQARDVAAKLLTDKLIGAKAFLVAEPNGKYKTTSYGDIWHYAAEPQSKPVEAVAVTGGEDITGTEEAEAIPDFGDDL
jgi:hypothetical protein